MKKLVDYLDKDQRIAALCARVETLEAALDAERKNGLALACIILSGSIDRTDKEAEKLLAAQRKAGAMWALKEAHAREYVRWADVGELVAAIESGEVEVPDVA